jgi:hypothetical protein
MKQFVSHFLAREIYALLLLMMVFSSPMFARQETAIVDECWAQFTPVASWATAHPGCEPDVTVTNCVPHSTLSDCSAGTGTVEIGSLMVYSEETPVALYDVRSIDGVVVTVLVDEF